MSKDIQNSIDKNNCFLDIQNLIDKYNCFLKIAYISYNDNDDDILYSQYILGKISAYEYIIKDLEELMKKYIDRK